MRTLLNIFFKSEANSWRVLLALLFANIAEGLGWASLVPLLSIVAPDQTGDLPRMTRFAQDALASFGVAMSLEVLLGFFVLAMISKSLLHFWAMTYVGTAVADLSTRLRSQLIRNIFNVRWSYLVDHPLGVFTNAISSQAQMASVAFEVTATFIARLLQSLTYLTVAFFISMPLALATVALGLTMVFSLNLLVRLARKAGNRETKRSRELVVFLTDTLINIKPLRAMMRQNSFSNLLVKKIAALRQAIRLRVVSSEALLSSQEILMTVILGIGIYIAITHWEMPFVELAVVGILLQKSTTNITKAQRIFQKSAAIERPYIEINELIRETARSPEPNPGTRPVVLEQCLLLDHISFSYGDTRILKDISLAIELGRITVLTGPSGAGKSTLADILTGLNTPDKGQVLIDGVPLQEVDLDSWRQLIGYVPQEPVLFYDSIYANIALGDPDLTEDDVYHALDLAGATDFIASQPAGIMTLVGQHGAKLSGGQRQRIAIARALIARPKLLILDEVTSALDSDAEIALCGKIRELSRETTIFAITHRPALVDIADRVIKIDNGQATDITL